ncbi:glycosyltransferase [Azoarcus sp. KH32C]|uniref:glycosyltransferase n=1 Tax=Azoarcus sp. KH32C TaxID=748247 RepID=UPI0009FE423C|nr:glycosyltransferase [Azoarcus sp. KH32C]
MIEDFYVSTVHTIPSVIQDAGGPSYSVVRLCESLTAQGHDVTLAALDWHPTKCNRPFLKLFPLGQGPKRLGRSPEMYKWLQGQARTDGRKVFHNHSLWMMPNVYSGLIRRGNKSPLIVSPRGTLSDVALRINKWQKRLFWHTYQNRAIRQANCFHATAHNEYQDIRNSGFEQPVCVLPNGIDVPDLIKRSTGERKRLLFLGRIHKIKGLENLLRAWEAVFRRYPDWDLQIIGPDADGYLAELQSLAARLNVGRVTFHGPLYGSQKLAAYRDATLTVLPTFSENFGMTVAESLAAGTPVIVTKGAPWEGLRERKAGWWIDVGVNPLVECLDDALAMAEDSIMAMGRRGHDWMLSDFSWNRIAKEMSGVYRWLIDGGEIPSCVRLD